MTDDELLKAYIREVKQLDQQGMTITLRLPPTDAMALIATIQLACRHPAFTGEIRPIVTRMVDHMQSEFLQYRVANIIEVIRRGWMDQ